MSSKSKVWKKAGNLLVAMGTAGVLKFAGDEDHCQALATGTFLSLSLLKPSLEVFFNMASNWASDRATEFGETVQYNVNSDLEKAFKEAYKEAIEQIEKDCFEKYDAIEPLDFRLINKIRGIESDEKKIRSFLHENFFKPLIKALTNENELENAIKEGELLQPRTYLSALIDIKFNNPPFKELLQADDESEFKSFVLDAFEKYYPHFFLQQIKHEEKARIAYWNFLLETTLLQMGELKSGQEELFNQVREIYSYLNLNFTDILDKLQAQNIQFAAFEAKHIEERTKIQQKLDAIIKPDLKPDDRSNKATTSNYYSYRYRYTSLMARENEIQRLWNFLEAERDFNWWMMTGPGGMGKSRLALDLCLALSYSGYWEAGFFDLNDDLINANPNWNKWEFVKNTFVVIDYAFSKIDQVKQIMVCLERAKTQPGIKVRLLLLDREVRKEWEKIIVGDTLISDSYYCEIPNQKKDEIIPLQLRGFNTSEKWRLIHEIVVKELVTDLGNNKIEQEVAVKRYFDIFRDRMEELETILSKIDPLGRPLFTFLAAIALSQGNDVRNWNTHELLKHVVAHQESIWEDYLSGNPVYKKYKNELKQLLTFNTLIRRMKVPQREEIINNLGIEKLDLVVFKEVYDIMVADKDKANKEWLGMEPDILGEFFILKTFKNLIDENSDIASNIYRWAWYAEPLNTAFTMYLAFQDFGEERNYPLPLLLNWQHFTEFSYEQANWAAALLRDVSNHLCENKNFDDGERYWDDLKQLSLIIITPEIALELAKGAHNLIIYIGDKGDLDKAEKYWLEIQKLRIQGFEDHAEIALWLAKGAVNLILYFGNKGDLDKGEIYWLEIQKLRKQGFEDHAEIALWLAKGAVNLIIDFGNKGDLDKGEIYWLEIQKLRKQGFEDHPDIALELAKSAYNICYYFVNKGDLDKAEKYWLEIQNLRKQGFEVHPEIALWLAKGAFNLINYFGNKEDFDMVEKYWLEIQKLRIQGFEDHPDIALELAKGAHNLIIDFGNIGDLDKAEKYWLEIQNLRKQGFEAHPDIALALAKGAFNLSKYFGDKNDSEKAEKYWLEIQNLRKQGIVQDVEITLLFANACLAVMYLFGNQGQFDKAIFYFNEFYAIFQSGYQVNEKFIELMQFAAGLLKQWGLLDDTEEA